MPDQEQGRVKYRMKRNIGRSMIHASQLLPDFDCVRCAPGILPLFRCWDQLTSTNQRAVGGRITQIMNGDGMGWDGMGCDAMSMPCPIFFLSPWVNGNESEMGKQGERRMRFCAKGQVTCTLVLVETTQPPAWNPYQKKKYK